jgi:hypothetical protein
MNHVEELGARLISAKQRYEDTGGISQILGFYRRDDFVFTNNGMENFIKRFKTPYYGTSITMYAARTYLYVMRLKKDGDKVKAECTYIGDLFKSINPVGGKILLRYELYKGYKKTMRTEGNYIFVDSYNVRPIRNKKLLEFLDESLGKIGNTYNERTNGEYISVDNVSQI